MAKKNPIPKKISGVKMPRTLRKSRMLRAMLGSARGRDLLGKALMAGAGAAAAVLVQERDEVADAGAKGARKGARAVGVAAEALESAAGAVMSTVSDAASSLLPEKSRNRKAAGGRNKKDGRNRQAVAH